MTGQSDEVQVHRRFRGPPTSGNGGYVAGLVAEWIDGPAEVDLLAPIPLEVPLHRRRDDAEVMLFDARPDYARGRPLDDPLDFDLPGPPSRGRAGGGGDELPRPAGPSDPRLLRLRHRTRPGRRPVHLSRRKPASRRGRGGMGSRRGTGGTRTAMSRNAISGRCSIAPAISACASRGRWRCWRESRRGSSGRSRPANGLRITGWELSREGRKHHAATVIHDEAGEVVALSRGAWIEIESKLPD